MTSDKMLIAIKLLSELDDEEYSRAIIGSAIEKTKSTAGAIGILELIKFELIEPIIRCPKCKIELIFDEKNGWFCPNDLCDMGYGFESFVCEECKKDLPTFLKPFFDNICEKCYLKIQARKDEEKEGVKA